MDFEGPLCRISFKRFGKDEVSFVFVGKKNLVLVINDLQGYPPEIFKRCLVCLHRRHGRIGLLRKRNILEPGPGKNHGEEIYPDTPAVGIPHVVLAKIDLGLPAIGSFFHNGILAGHYYFRDAVLLANPHHKIVHGLLAHFWEILVMFLEPVVQLGRRRVGVG